MREDSVSVEDHCLHLSSAIFAYLIQIMQIRLDAKIGLSLVQAAPGLSTTILSKKVRVILERFWYLALVVIICM